MNFWPDLQTHNTVIDQLDANDKQQHVDEAKEKPIAYPAVQPDPGIDTNRGKRSEDQCREQIATVELTEPRIRDEFDVVNNGEKRH